jgi:hypothetical protein
MILISDVNFEHLRRILSKNVCSCRTNLELIHYQVNQFQCNKGMMSNG